MLRLQWLGLRSRMSELLQLSKDDPMPPHMNYVCGTTRIILLWRKMGTQRSGRQFVQLPPKDNPVDLMILLAFWRSTTAGVRVTTLGSLGQYATALRQAARALGAEAIGWTPHSARAGWATYRRMAGKDFSELREKGRWESGVSLQVYLDVVGSVELDC